jgi:hypothetical protein
MKVNLITYNKTFNIGPYLNEKVGIECSVDEGEDPSDVLDKAKEKIESWHMASRVAEEAKQKEMEYGKVIYSDPILGMTDKLPMSYHYPPTEINIQDEKKEISIENAKSIEELASLKKDLPTNLMPNYIKKLTELTEKIK